MGYGSEGGLRLDFTATGVALATATYTGVKDKIFNITDVSVSSDKAGSIVLIKEGTTVIWQDIVGVGRYSQTFTTPMPIAPGTNCSVEIDGTAACKANFIGYQI